MARAGTFGFAVSSSTSATSTSASSSSSTPVPAGGATSTTIVVAAPRLGHELALDELLAHTGRVGIFAVDLGDGDDDRHVGRACVVDGLDRLRHHTVVGRDDEHHDVGGVGPARTHGGERLVARSVDERDRVAAVDGLVRADVLSDAARFTGDHVGAADRVEQGGLAVVDVAHDGDDRGARLGQRVVFVVVVAEECLQLELGLLAGLDEQHFGAERLGDELDHLVGERLRAGDHLARVEQQPHEVGGRAVQLGRELLDGDAALDDDLAFGDRGVTRRELRQRRGADVFEIATTTLLAPRPLALRAGATASAGAATTRTTGAATTRTTTGTTAAGRTLAATTGTAAGAAEPAAGTLTTEPASAAGSTAATGATRGTTGARARGARRDPGARGRRDAPCPAGGRRDRTAGHAPRRARRGALRRRG